MIYESQHSYFLYVIMLELLMKQLKFLWIPFFFSFSIFGKIYDFNPLTNKYTSIDTIQPDRVYAHESEVSGELDYSISLAPDQQINLGRGGHALLAKVYPDYKKALEKIDPRKTNEASVLAYWPLGTGTLLPASFFGLKEEGFYHLAIIENANQTIVSPKIFELPPKEIANIKQKIKKELMAQGRAATKALSKVWLRVPQGQKAEGQIRFFFEGASAIYAWHLSPQGWKLLPRRVIDLDNDEFTIENSAVLQDDQLYLTYQEEENDAYWAYAIAIKNEQGDRKLWPLAHGSVVTASMAGPNFANRYGRETAFFLDAYNRERPFKKITERTPALLIHPNRDYYIRGKKGTWELRHGYQTEGAPISPPSMIYLPKHPTEYRLGYFWGTIPAEGITTYRGRPRAYTLLPGGVAYIEGAGFLSYSFSPIQFGSFIHRAPPAVHFGPH